MEATSDAAAPTPAPFAGRALSFEMGSVRLGGSGRPVTIATTASDAHDDRHPPRVVLEPQPRSPFGRKLETTVSASLSSLETTRCAPVRTIVPPERVHSVHHPTHRTLVADALRRVDRPTPLEAPSPQVALSRKRPARDTKDQQPSIALRPKAKKNAPAIAVEESKRESVIQRSVPRVAPTDLKPDQLSRLTRDPRSVDDADRERPSFHLHERLSRIEEEAAIEDVAAADDALSGWRAVDDSIDYIYEDPSIDIAQLQLLLNGRARAGDKRKAREKERLQAAAAEIQKQRQGQNAKSLEFQRRREQILQMSEVIRTRNKGSTQKIVARSQSAAIGKNKAEDTSALPTRKPPVPRLSQLGVKAKPSKQKKKARGVSERPTQEADHLDSRVPSSLDILEDPAIADEGDGEDLGERQSDSRVAESILLSADNSKAPANQVRAKPPPVRAIKKRKPASPSSQLRPVAHSSQPPEEQLQRRAVAREYMQIQKQTRQLLRAKLEQQRQLEEERRRLELQRLEQTRLQDLEEARKRRARQKQRDRVAQRKQDEEKRRLECDRRDKIISGDTTCMEQANREDKDTENQSFRGNDPAHQRFENDNFEWPDNDQDSLPASSKGSSPRTVTHGKCKRSNARDAAEAGPNLQKLLALEEQAKMLAQKLQLLSKPRTPSASNRSPHRVETHTGETSGDEMDASNSSRSVASEGSDGSRSPSRPLYAPDEDDDSDDIDDHQSDTRVDRADFFSFDGGFPHFRDLDEGCDFSSIGVQKIQVVWPSNNIDDDEDEHAVSDRFEILPSSSSSSSVSSRQIHDNDRTGRAYHTRSPSPKLLEESVDAYAQRLLDLSARERTSSSFETPISEAEVPTCKAETDNRVPSTSHVRTDVTPPKRKRQTVTADDELLRLIRESDDNLSVIDREAKRRFRLQQDRWKQRQQEQERLDAERLKANFDPRVSKSLPTSSSTSIPRVRDEEVTTVANATEGIHVPAFEKLDEILEAVRTKSVEMDDCDGKSETSEASEQEPSKQSIPAVAFWNSQLQPPSAGGREHLGRAPRVEIDRREIRAQEEHRSKSDDEDDDSSSTRLLSPQALAKRLLAAVEFHEAIHEAHLQLSVMEKEHALERVQQDTIALAQAFKEEMDDNVTAQQLLDEHAALEGEFDLQLKQVVEQFETVREAEHRESETLRNRLEEEAKQAKRRESAVQTEPPHQVDAATSACLRVEVASTTDNERFDASVQYSADSSPVASTPRRKDAKSLGSEPRVMRSILQDESDDYDHETFDQASVSSAMKPLAQVKQVSTTVPAAEDEDMSVVDDAAAVGSDGDEAIIVSTSRNDVGEEIASEEEGGSIESESLKEEAQSMIEDEVIFAPAASNSRRHSQSASVVYDDDDFEDETSFVQSKAPVPFEQVEVSEDEVRESDEHEASASDAPNEPNSIAYGEDDFEHDASTSRDAKPPMSVAHASSVAKESSESAVSSAYEDGIEDSVGDAEPVSDSPSMETQEIPVVSPTKVEEHAPSSMRGLGGETPSLQNVTLSPAVVPVARVAVDISHFVSTMPMAPELMQSYLAQLEKRKRSEEALLDIRLLALESKLRQDLDRLDEEMMGQRDEKKRSELVLHRDAFQVSYLSEKANIESQKSACISRYYQDLLALRSLGAMGTELSAIVNKTSTVSVPPSAPPLPVISSTYLVKSQAMPSRSDAKDDLSLSDPYGDDEFVASDAVSGTHSARDEERNVEKPQEASEGAVEEEEEEIRSEQSIESEEKASIPCAPDDDQDYDLEDFASVSESANTEKHAVDKEAASVQSTPSVVGEASARLDTNDAEARVVYEDDFAAVNGDDLVEEGPSGSQQVDSDILPVEEEVDDLGAEPITEIAVVPDEASQVYDDDEFASVSEHATDAEQATVSEEDATENEQEAVEETQNDIEETPAAGEIIVDEYDDEFASVSEDAVVADEVEAVSEDNIHDGTPVIEPITNDGTVSSVGEQGRNDYADDGFDESELLLEKDDVASDYADDRFDESAVQLEKDQVMAECAVVDDDSKVEDEESERYSDDDFEPGDVRSSTSSDTAHRTIQANGGEFPVTDTVNETAVQSPTELAILEVEQQVIPELTIIKSLSASELSVGHLPLTTDEDTVTKPLSLAESVSLNQHDESLTTASMEEQIKRIDDLKRQIDLRKEAFVAVQKNLRVEKKKEYLRAAETQLWEEMEQLETQLVADERILELTRQRGRLESMELEAKHQQLHGKESLDLLADYDYSEPVELIKPVVMKQDHQAQVRLADRSSIALPSQTVVPQRTGESDLDLLLAFDHVEAVELPVKTVATNTEEANDPAPPLMMENATATSDSPILVGDIVGLHQLRQPRSDSADESPKLVETSDADADLPPACEGFDTDLLVGFDHVEVAEMPDIADDLLYAYDHVEPVVEVNAVARRDDMTVIPSVAPPDVEDTTHRNEDVFVQIKKKDLDGQGELDRSEFGAEDEGEEQANEERCVPHHTDPSQDVERTLSQATPQEAIGSKEMVNDPANHSGSSVGGVKGDDEMPEDVASDHESEIGEDPNGGDVSAHDEMPAEPFTDRFLDTESAQAALELTNRNDEESFIDRTTEELLARLVLGAVSDIRSASANKTARMGIVDTSASHHEQISPTQDVIEPPRNETRLEQVFDQLDDEKKEALGDLLEPTDLNTPDERDNHVDSRLVELENTPEKPLNREDQATSIVDSVFADLTATAIWEGIRIEVKRRNVRCQDKSSNQPPSVSLVRGSQTTPVQSYRNIERDIVRLLRLEADRVTLPDYYECISSRDDTANARAVYDAVLEVASTAFTDLSRDPLFTTECSVVEKQAMLVERVVHEMEESAWRVQERAQDELDRFARRVLEEEQGDADDDDVLVLRAQQRVGLSDALLSQFQITALRSLPRTPAPTSGATPRQRRRLGSASSTHLQSPGLGSQILERGEDRLVERITERMMHSLVQTETSQRRPPNGRF